MKSIGTEVEWADAIRKTTPVLVEIWDFPREILVRLVGSKMRVVKGVCKFLHALVNENRATTIMKAMVDKKETATMNLEFVLSVLRSPAAMT